MKPRLSIIIPSYNYGRYLPEALDSILEQGYDDYEVLLVDDASTDESPEISRRYAAAHSQIRYFQQETNLGLFQNYLTGLRESRGDYIHFLSADDKYLPGYLSKVMGFLEERPEVGVVCTDISYFQNDMIREIRLLPKETEPQFFSRDKIVEHIRTTGFWVTGATCIVRRELFNKYGPLIPRLENLSDWYLYHTIALREGIGYIPEVLTSMREHSISLTKSVKGNKKRRRAVYHYLLHELLKDRGLRERYLRAGLLDFIFRDLKLKLYFNPRYLCYWRCKK